MNLITTQNQTLSLTALPDHTKSESQVHVGVSPIYLLTCPCQLVDFSGLGVTLYDPIPLGRNTTSEGNHVHWSEFKMFDSTSSKLL